MKIVESGGMEGIMEAIRAGNFERYGTYAFWSLRQQMELDERNRVGDVMRHRNNL